MVVAGPTASGKSDLAIRLARRFNGEIISADSRQVYRGMDIGTGKVTKAEQKLARHWMLDVASPARQYSVATWRREARKAIADITRRGKLPIICGGTGFWIDALVYDLNLPAVRPDTKLRKRFDMLTAEHLFKMLQKLDPARAATIDRHNPRRLVRALEIVMVTGKPVPPGINGSLHEPLYLAVSMPKEKLARRIEKRLDARLKAGMIAEVKRLRRQGISWKRLESFGLEYRWLARYLQAKSSKLQAVSYSEVRDGLLHDIVQYAKRQMTWFKKNTDIVWVSGLARAALLTKTFLKKEESPM